MSRRHPCCRMLEHRLRCCLLLQQLSGRNVLGAELPLVADGKEAPTYPAVIPKGMLRCHSCEVGFDGLVPLMEHTW